MTKTTYNYLIDTEDNPLLINPLDNIDLDQLKFCWLHFQISEHMNSTIIRDQIENLIDIDSTAINELLSDDTRPAYKNYQSDHLLIIRCINPNKRDLNDEMVPLHIWIKNRVIITVSDSDIYAINSLINEINELHINSKSEFLIELFTRILDRITEVIDDIDDSIDRLDSELEDTEFSLSIERILAVRKRLLALRRFTNPQKDLLQKVLKGTGVSYDECQSFIFRDLSDRYYKLIEDIDHLRDQLTLISESVNNKRNESMNKTMYTMSIVASLFLPLGFLTGLFGVNVGGMPGVNSNSGF